MKGVVSVFLSFYPYGRKLEANRCIRRSLGVDRLSRLKLYMAASDNIRGECYTCILPLFLASNRMLMTAAQRSKPDPPISAGTWSGGPSETIPEVESSCNILTNGAKVQFCCGLFGSEDVDYIGVAPSGTLTFEGFRVRWRL